MCFVGLLERSYEMKKFKRKQHPNMCMCASCQSRRGDSPNLGNHYGGGWNRGLTKEISKGVKSQADKLKGRRCSESHKAKVSASKRGKSRPDMVGDNNPMKDPNVVRKVLKSQHKGKTKPEVFVEWVLEQICPGEWEFVGDGSFMVGRKCPDFKHKTKNMLIEVFGDYWHSEAVTGVLEDEHEQQRIRMFEEKGYQTLVVWEHDLFDQWRLSQLLGQFSEFGCVTF